MANEYKLQFTGAEIDERLRKIDQLDYGVIETASGETLSLTDASNTALRGLVVYGKSTQNGTPSPGAPVPIVSAFDNADSVNITGKNLLRGAPVTYSKGLSVKANTDGSVTVSGSLATAGSALLYIFNAIQDKNYKKIWLRPGMQYSYSLYKDGVKYTGKTTLRFKEKESSTTGLYNVTKEMYVDAIYIQLDLEAGDTSLCGTYWIQFELGKTATAYEPHIGCQSLPISTPLCGVPVASGGNYTDANGQQWVCDEIDFARGVKVQRVKKITDFTTQTMQDKTIVNDNMARFNMWLEGVKIANEQAICSHFKSSGWMYENATGQDAITTNPTTSLISIFTTTFKDYSVSEMREYLTANNVVVVYALAEPIETPLTEEELAAYHAAALHTNYPITTIYADGSAGLAVTYRADTKSYIDKKFAELTSALNINATDSSEN